MKEELNEEVIEEQEIDTAQEATEVEEEALEKDETTALREELERQKRRAKENLAGWQRAQADFSNYKRRQQQEMENIRQLGNEQLLMKLLPLADDFERAFTTLPYSLRELSWIEGIWLVGRRLLAIFEQEGIQPIETNDAEFDPRWHEAVIHEETTEYEDGQIMEEFQRGYRIRDRVLRPALVKVAKAATVEEKEDEPPETEITLSVAEDETTAEESQMEKTASDLDNDSDDKEEVT